MNKKEIKNLQEHMQAIVPNACELPCLNGFDIYGESIQLHSNLGGDHIIYVDFKKRYALDSLIQQTLTSQKSEFDKKRIVDNLNKTKTKLAILLADVSGHDMTDIVLTSGFHQAFLTGVSYELKMNGEVTRDLIDILNNRFVNSSSRCKFLTVIYGEFDENGDFGFISAGHPLPLIYSYEQEAVCRLHKSSYVSSLPMSMFPSAEQNVEHSQKFSCSFTRFAVIKEDLLRFAKPKDDISFVIIRKK